MQDRREREGGWRVRERDIEEGRERGAEGTCCLDSKSPLTHAPCALLQRKQVGQTMAFGSGVSWQPILAAAQAHARHRTQLRASTSFSPSSHVRSAPNPVAPAFVPDVSEKEGVVFFRPSPVNGASHGSYLAVPLVGAGGQVR
jgi:hypothetical protein